MAVETWDPAVDYRDFSHTGPGTLAGRYLRTFWWPVSRPQDLLSGRALPIRILGEDFTLYRGDDGSAHLLAFRCAHRGHAALNRMGRRRPTPLLLPRLEVRA